MPGNHETAILKNHETFLTERLIERIQERTKHRIPKGGFTTWIRFIFCEKGETSFNPSTVTMFCHHGYGGGGPVTRGVIQTNRMAVYLPDAQIVATGHTHDEFQVPISRARLSVRGVPYQDEQLHLKIPSYKDEYANGEGGWHIERGGPPKPIGALWLTFSMRNKQIFTEVTRAR